MVLLVTAALIFAHVASRAAQPAAADRPPIIGIANVALRVSDLSAAKKFFEYTLGFDELPANHQHNGQAGFLYFKVNDEQYIEISPTLQSPTEDRLIDIAFETTNARRLRQYLASRGVPIPETVQKDADGNLSFSVKDPDGHTIEFVQYLPGSHEGRNRGKLLGSGRTSKQIIHAGVTVQDRAEADRFYRDILGFREMWHGGRTDDRTDWVDMQVPNGKNWLEYMLNVHNPTPRQLGVMHHLALGVESVKVVEAAVQERGEKPEEAHIGRDGKWQLNLYDPDFTRIEFMEFKPVRTPCCSPMRSAGN